MNTNNKAHCPKCGNDVLGEDDVLCGECSGEQPETVGDDEEPF